jgi:hypothetical protein
MFFKFHLISHRYDNAFARATNRKENDVLLKIITRFDRVDYRLRNDSSRCTTSVCKKNSEKTTTTTTTTSDEKENETMRWYLGYPATCLFLSLERTSVRLIHWLSLLIFSLVINRSSSNNERVEIHRKNTQDKRRFNMNKLIDVDCWQCCVCHLLRIYLERNIWFVNRTNRFQLFMCD